MSFSSSSATVSIDSDRKMDTPLVMSVDDEDGEGIYSIDVVVCVRPLNHMEHSEQNCVCVVEGSMVVVLTRWRAARRNYLRRSRSHEKRYVFDHTFARPHPRVSKAKKTKRNFKKKLKLQNRGENGKNRKTPSLEYNGNHSGAAPSGLSACRVPQ